MDVSHEAPAVFDLSVKWHAGTWQPRQRPLSADQVVFYVDDALRMLGRRLPDFLLDPDFPALLAEKGEFTAEVDGIELKIRRAA